MTTVTEQATTDLDAAEEIAGRVFTEGAGAFHAACTFIGVRLGLYRALSEEGPLTAAELAARQGLDEWYTREWAQSQVISGLIALDGDLTTGHFRLSPGVREALVEETSPFYVGGVAVAVAAVGRGLPFVVDAFRTGEGVPYAAYGSEGVEAQASLNRPAFVNSLADEWIAAVPGVSARLAVIDPPARVADIGCGVGWSAIELATAFPHVRIDGYDIDDESISQARRLAAERGLTDRIDFELHDVSKTDLGQARYDLVLFFECLHDMARPVEALANARRAVRPGGHVIVMDERVAESLAGPGDLMETFLASASVVWCLPQSRVEPDCEATGTLMRPDTLRRLAERAGFSSTTILDIEHPSFRFYELIP